MAIAVAAMLVAVAAIGIVLYLNSGGEDRSDQGILLFRDTDDYDFISVGSGDVDAASAFYIALDIDPPAATLSAASENIGDWELWAVEKGGSDWTLLTDDPANVLLSGYDAVSWSFIGKPPVPANASMMELFSMIGDYERIVCMSASITEMVAALAPDKIAGVDDYSDYPASVTSTAIKVGSYWDGVNFEMIMNADPDLVIMDGDVFGQEPVIKRLKDAGKTVLVVSSHKGSVEGVCQNILSIGLITKSIDTANGIVAEIMSISDDLTLLVSATDPAERKILIMMPPWGSSVWVAGDGGTTGSFIVTLGLENALTLVESWAEPNIESVLGSDPYIVVVMVDIFSKPYDYSDLAAHPQLGTLSAVSEGRVCILEDRANDVMSRAGPGIIDAMGILCYLATLDWSEITEGVTIGNDYMDYLDTLGVF